MCYSNNIFYQFAFYCRHFGIRSDDIAPFEQAYGDRSLFSNEEKGGVQGKKTGMRAKEC